MSNTEFGVSISEELGEELDELTEECVDLQASRSEVVEAILTAYFQSDVDHEHESASSSSAAEKEPLTGLLPVVAAATSTSISVTSEGMHR